MSVFIVIPARLECFFQFTIQPYGSTDEERNAKEKCHPEQDQQIRIDEILKGPCCEGNIPVTIDVDLDDESDVN